jgi:cytidylate kinase
LTVIAIDGPAGAGKSTVAKMVAEASGLPYLDTGAMYRCVALQTLRDKVDPTAASIVGFVAENAVISVEGTCSSLNGEDVSDLIRTPEIAAIVSVIATHTPVRTAMRHQQQRWIASHGGGVVEGRDIGTVVFPEAKVKIFLTASPDERATRRVGQSGGDIASVAANIAERDRIDSERVDSPLRPAEDAIIVDSTGLNIAEVVTIIVGHYKDSQR